MSKVNKIVIKGAEYELEDSRVEQIQETVQEIQNNLLTAEDIINDESPSDSTTYSSNKITSLLENLTLGLTLKVVTSLPDANSADTKVVYLIRKANAENENIYDEYICIDKSWEKIGDTTINLEEYLKIATANALYVKQSTLESYSTTEQVQRMIQDHFPQDNDTIYQGSSSIDVNNTTHVISANYQNIAEGVRSFNDYSANDNIIEINNVSRKIGINRASLDIPAAQIQSNWAETNQNSKAYIQNKPATSYTKAQGSPIVINESLRTIGLDINALQELIDQRIISKSSTITSSMNKIEVIDGGDISNDLRNITNLGLDLKQDDVIILVPTIGVQVKYLIGNMLKTLTPNESFDLMFRYDGNNNFVPLFPVIS